MYIQAGTKILIVHNVCGQNKEAGHKVVLLIFHHSRITSSPQNLCSCPNGAYDGKLKTEKKLMPSHPEEDEGGGCCWLYPEKDDCWL